MSDKLNTEQQLIFNKYINGENIFITGPGGTGKTYLIKAIAEHAKENNKAFKVTALTGCAAILLECGATTLHAFAGIGLATGTIKQVVDRVVKNRHKKLNWQKIDTLIVDEVSMLSLKLIQILDQIGRKVKKEPTKSFGGIQILFSGDFYQLPPVGDEDDPETTQFCFETPLWNETFSLENQIQLKTIFRQTDPEYVKILNGLRVGKITNNRIATLLNCVKTPTDTSLKPTTILPRRRDADTINYRELDKLDIETEKIYKTSAVSEEDLPLTKEQYKNLALFTPKEREYEIEYLTNNIMAEKEIKLRLGAVVMCIVNLNTESYRPIINGSQGKIVEFVDNYPVVEFTNGSKEVIGPHTWQSERLPGIAIKQVPLIYAWAITIHKAQGLTLEQAVIDIGANIFECGQTYVALSRVKSLEGLYLKSFDHRKIKINRKVKLFYDHLN
jgi:ATP-dependent DNA helicase PIF1